MLRYRAAWILPIVARPLRDGWVGIDRGRITAIGRLRDLDTSPSPDREIDLGSVAVLPGLVNAHTHLELSWLRGQVPSARAMPTWVRDLMARRAEGRGESRDAMVTAADEAWRAGTALIGDISNTLTSVEPLSRARVAAVVFKEIIGFSAQDATAVVREALDAIAAIPTGDRVRASLAAHAPYSVAPSVFRAIRTELRPSAPCSVHLAESREELEFLRTGTGAWRDLLEQIGAWDPGWTPPACGPVAYLDRLGWLERRVIVAHGVHLTAAELTELARRGATLVTCPRSNVWTGAGTPPVERFFASGVRVAIGTDSLGSAPDLNLFSELAELRRLAPSVPAAALLDSATRQGAHALGFRAEFGSIESGQRGALIAVRVPETVEDVEEYLLSGVKPDDIRWLDVDEHA